MVINHFYFSINDLFLCLAIEILNITRFVVKIGLKNQPSIRLFTTKLHFQTVNQQFDIGFIHEYLFLD